MQLNLSGEGVGEKLWLINLSENCGHVECPEPRHLGLLAAFEHVALLRLAFSSMPALETTPHI